MHWFKRKYGLIIKAAVIVLFLIALKAVLHFLNLEIIAVTPVITALITGVFFVLAIILSGVLADYKASEKIPSDLTASIEALYKDTKLAGNQDATRDMLNHIRDLVHTLVSNFERRNTWKISEVNTVIDQIDEDIRSFAEKNVPINLIIKLRNEISTIKKISNRVEVIKEMPFLSAGHAIAEFAMGSALIVLLLLKLDPYYEGLFLIGLISIILISVVLLIRDMDNPFDGHASVDLRQLYKLDKYLDAK
jgi:hypothetical protein